MTAREARIVASPTGAAGGGPLLGFATVSRKEVTEWVRGSRGRVVALSGIAIGAFTVLIPFIVKATDRMGTAPAFSMDPTDNVLLGWSSGTVTFQAFLSVLATVGLMTVERDRGTLAWTLANPVSRTAFLSAKWAAGVAMLAVLSVVIPMTTQVVIAYFAYGGLADIPQLVAFATLYLVVPAFYVAVTVAAGTLLSSTAAVAGIGLAVMFLPALIAPLFPGIAAVSPTSGHAWAYAVISGGTVDWTVPLATVISVVTLGVIAKVAFDRQDI